MGHICQKYRPGPSHFKESGQRCQRPSPIVAVAQQGQISVPLMMTAFLGTTTMPSRT